MCHAVCVSRCVCCCMVGYNVCVTLCVCVQVKSRPLQDIFHFLVMFNVPPSLLLPSLLPSLLLLPHCVLLPRCRPLLCAAALSLPSLTVWVQVAPGDGIFAKYDLKGSTNGRRERTDQTSFQDPDSSLRGQWEKAKGQYGGTLLDLDYEQDKDEYGRPIEVSLQYQQPCFHSLSAAH